MRVSARFAEAGREQEGSLGSEGKRKRTAAEPANEKEAQGRRGKKRQDGNDPRRDLAGVPVGKSERESQMCRYLCLELSAGWIDGSCWEHS